MAFTGTAVVKKVTDKLFRITGLSLIADASGTIGFSDKTVAAEVSLVAPEWQPYRNASAALISLQSAVGVRITLVTDVTVPVPLSVVKTGTSHADFAITIHNDDVGEGQTSPGLEIWVEFH